MLKRIWRGLSSAWLLSLLAVLAGVALIWFLGPVVVVAGYAPLASPGARLLAVLALLLPWGLSDLYSRRRGRREAEGFDKALTAQSRPPTAGQGAPDPDQEALVQRLQAALATLRKAGKGRGRQLYQLPWYVLIGAPGSGKSTALQHSGLRFPLQSQIADGAVQGAGGTRHCDWWFTDEAVFLDTAGRYTTQDNPGQDDGGSWRAFLAMLRKCRPRRPLSGVIVTVALGDLASQTATQRSLHAAAIKRRIQELNGHLGMELPVYLLFTKVDLVPGFTESFAELEAEERDRCWGVSLPLREPGRSAALNDFARSYGGLLQRAEGRALRRLLTERALSTRSLAYQFPRQMLGLAETLRSFLGEVFLANQFERGALLRGVYFVSATQSSAPARWLHGVLPTALLAPPPANGARAAPRAYFLKTLISERILGEQGLATADRQGRRRHRRLQAALMASALMLFGGALSAWGLSYQRNSELMARLDVALARYREQAAVAPATVTDWGALATHLQALRQLPVGYATDPAAASLTAGFGLYQGEKLASQAGKVYLRALERDFLPALARKLEALLQDSEVGEDYLYEALRFYLMLHRPTRMERENFRAWAELLWKRALPGDDFQSTRESLGRHLSTALDESLQAPPPNTAAIAAARRGLARTSLERRIYRRLKHDHQRRQPQPFSVRAALGAGAERLFVRRSGASLSEGVPAFYTYQGFHGGFLLQSRQLARRLADEQWIYGEQAEPVPSEEALAALSDQVQALYFRDYIAHWRALLNDLRLRGFDQAGAGWQRLSLLAGGDRPLRRLLLRIRRHTALNEPPGAELQALAPGATTALPGAPVAQAFAAFNDWADSAPAAPLSALEPALSALADYLLNLDQAGDPGTLALQALAGEGGGGLPRALQAVALRAPEPLGHWLQPLQRDTASLTRSLAGVRLNRLWQADVLTPYHSALAGRYPLRADAREEVGLADFTRFFGPGGHLEQYFQRHLAPLVRHDAQGLRWRTATGLSRGALRVFERAQAVRRAFFDGAGAPHVGFRLRPRLLEKAALGVRLDNGTQTLSYQHGPRREQGMSWPGEGAGATRLVFQLASRSLPLSVRTEGAWSWFRLIERHGRLQPASGGYLLSLELDGVEAQFELRGDGPEPYGLQILRDFTLPARL